MSHEWYDGEPFDVCPKCGEQIERYGEYSDEEIARFSATERARYDSFQQQNMADHDLDCPGDE